MYALGGNTFIHYDITFIGFVLVVCFRNMYALGGNTFIHYNITFIGFVLVVCASCIIYSFS